MKTKKSEIQSKLILATEIIEESLEELNLDLVIRQVEDNVMICLRDLKTKKDYLVIKKGRNDYTIIEFPEKKR